jgi:spermidine synthase
MEGSFFGLCAGYGIVALLARPGPASVAWLRRPVSWAAAGFVAALVVFPFGKLEGVYLRMSIGYWNSDGSYEVVTVREGRTETSVLLRHAIGGESLYYSLLTDSYAMSTTDFFARRYQKLYVYWPVAMHAGAENALLISYGVGNTAKALVDTRTLARIDVVDISRDILALSEFIYPDPADHPLNDPRVHVHVEDGRFFLQTTNRHYDLITGEPPPPKNAGVVNLYTREYFQLIHDRLTQGGIVTYWLPVHNILLSDTKAITRAFCDVFVDCSLWSGQDLDWMLVGSRGGIAAPSEQALSRQWRDPALQAELRAVGFELPEQLGKLLSDALPLTDDRPKRLANGGQSRVRARRTYSAWLDPRDHRDRFQASTFIATTWPDALREHTLPYFEAQEVIESIASGEEIQFARRLRDVHWMVTETPLVAAPLWRMGGSVDRLRTIDTLISRGAPADPYRELLARRAVARREFDAAVELLDHPKVPRGWRTLYFRWYALAMAERGDEARAFARSHRNPLRAAPEAPALWEFMERTFGAPD